MLSFFSYIVMDKAEDIANKIMLIIVDIKINFSYTLLLIL